MTLLKSVSPVIAFTGGVVMLFFMRQIKLKCSTIYETLKEKIINLKNNNFKIPELPNPNWIKVGRVDELHIRPLASGDKIKCSKLQFTPYGAITKEKGLILQDKMFHIYNKKTKQFQNTHTITAIQLMRIDMLNKFEAKFSFIGESNIIINIHKETRENRKILKVLKTSWIEIRYIDCGEEIAKWLNRKLYTSDMRLVRVEYDILDEPIIEKHLPENDDEVWEIFLNLTGYTVVTINTMAEFMYNFTQYLKIQPHVLISAPNYPEFVEASWEWIRIGNIIMKRIMPVSHLRSVQESFKKQESHHPPHFWEFFMTCTLLEKQP